MGRKGERRCTGFCPYKRCLEPVYRNWPLCDKHAGLCDREILKAYRKNAEGWSTSLTDLVESGKLLLALFASIERAELALEGGEGPTPAQPKLPGME